MWKSSDPVTKWMYSSRLPSSMGVLHANERALDKELGTLGTRNIYRGVVRYI